MDKIVVGLTGQSGTGKSTVAKMFAVEGFDVIDADAVAKEITSTKETALKLSETFGDEILQEDGFLNRKALAKIVFSDNDQLQKLNSILHPIISRKIVRLIKNCTHKYVLIDAPQLFESGLNEICDKVIAIIAPTGLLIERIMKRDSVDREMATKRLLSQFSTDFFKEHADIVIENNNDFLKLRIDVEVAIRTIKGCADSFDL